VSYSAGLIRKSCVYWRGARYCCAWSPQARSAGRGVHHRNGGRQDRSASIRCQREAAGYAHGSGVRIADGKLWAYLFARVPAGQGYTLTVSKESFKTVNISKLVLAVTETATFDVTLELGNVSQTIQVTANSGAGLTPLTRRSGMTLIRDGWRNCRACFERMRRRCCSWLQGWSGMTTAGWSRTASWGR